MIFRARNAYLRLVSVGTGAALLGSIAMAGSVAASSVALPHIHGLAYDSGGRLHVAVHDGMVVFSEGRWSNGSLARHDYMGFTGTRKHFFSSGHPAPGSGMVNPLGFMQSADAGKTWTKRGLEGESDFHLMAAGFDNDAVYVFNAERNSRMTQAGIYYTLNQGFSWRRAAGAGLNGQLRSLAVHPTNDAIVAAGTDAGVFLSRDHGERFEALAKGPRGLALQFDPDGKSLWIGSFDTAPTLERRSFDGPRRENIALPRLGRDAVAYIAHNPARPGEMAITTFERSVFVSRDRGKTWKEIATHGQAK